MKDVGFCEGNVARSASDERNAERSEADAATKCDSTEERRGARRSESDDEPEADETPRR